MEKIVIVKGMTCGHCAGRVKDELEKVDGVISADVSADADQAVIQLEEEIDYDLLRKAVENAGYNFVEVS